MNSKDLAMRMEHSAWLHVMDEWKRLDFPDINDERFNPLCRAIELWGERFAALRREQPASDCDKWLDQAEKAYEQLGE